MPRENISVYIMFWVGVAFVLILLYIIYEISRVLLRFFRDGDAYERKRLQKQHDHGRKLKKLRAKLKDLRSLMAYQASSDFFFENRFKAKILAFDFRTRLMQAEIAEIGSSQARRRELGRFYSQSVNRYGDGPLQRYHFFGHRESVEELWDDYIRQLQNEFFQLGLEQATDFCNRVWNELVYLEKQVEKSEKDLRRLQKEMNQSWWL